jgi:4'-phosphopantetheinyl transferase
MDSYRKNAFTAIQIDTPGRIPYISRNQKQVPCSVAAGCGDRENSRIMGRNGLLDLPVGEIHLWFAFPGEAGDPQTPSPAPPLLDEEEWARMARLHFPEARRLFGVSHTLVRTTLSNYSEIRPGEWRFVKNAHGKPSIDPDLDSAPLSFSLSHTRGIAVVAVARGADVGADVERADRKVDAARLAGRFFSPGEATALEEISPDRLRDRFFLYWTLKESYIKARGIGLSLPLDSFSFRLGEKRPFRIDFSGGDHDSRSWRFAVLRPRPQYIAAVGFAPARPDPVRIRCFHTLPSGEVSPLTPEPVAQSPGVDVA